MSYRAFHFSRSGPLLACALWACAASGLGPAPRCVGSELRRTAFVRAIEAAAPAVVNIHGEKTVRAEQTQRMAADSIQRVNGMGTGVIIDERGYIVTNHHVIDAVQQIEVTLADGTTRIARRVAHDALTDLAIIKIDADRKHPTITIGTSRDLMRAEEVIAIGNAFGYAHTVTRGVISALHRDVPVGDTQSYKDLIQTDASINPGNSGGPLLNIDGEMIGINVAVRVGAQGIGFAIPVDHVMEVAARLLQNERRRSQGTWHGVVTAAQETLSQTGVGVARVTRGSPAEEAGLESGDRILAIDDQTLDRSLDLERALLAHRAGETVRFTVARGSDRIELPLKLASAPRTAATVTSRAWQMLGVRLRPVPPDHFRRLESHYSGGLAVVDVRPNSPAARHGIRGGDILVGMHIWETVSMDNIEYILTRGDLSNFDSVKFYILRDNEPLFGHMTVSSRR